MDLTMPAQKEKVTSELKNAIKNINRNIYEWKSGKSGKINFTMSYNEVYSLTKNWIVRCLRTITDPVTIDRIIRGGHILISMDEDNMCLNRITLANYETFRSYYKTAEIMNDILSKLDYTALRYDPKQYASDGVSARKDPFFYPQYEPMSITTVGYESLKPKNG